MPYVDGFVIPFPKKNLAAYKRMAKRAGAVWMDLGALEYRECIGEDLGQSFGMPFPKQLKAKSGETVAFSWVVYRNRAHRDRVNAKVMKDKRIMAMMKIKPMPFDVKRMLYGGFETIVDLPARRRRGRA